MLSPQVTYPRRRRKVIGEGPPPAIFAVFVVLGSAVTLAMLGYIVEGVQHSAAAYITALTVDYFTVVFGSAPRAGSARWRKYPSLVLKKISLVTQKGRAFLERCSGKHL